MHTNLSANIYQTGDSSVFKLDTTLIEKPKAQQVLLKQTAIGVNYIDTYFRSGLYPIDLPATLGDEAVGVIEQVGEGVTEFSVGQRVAYSAAKGAYTQYRVVDINELVPIPDNIDDVILIHAAAGGVGQIACQWARAIGATVIGTVSSTEKARIAKRNGCDFVINYTEQDFVKAVDEITNGQKVDVVYDGVGKDTFTQSLDCLRVRGLMVSFGNASGKPDPFDVLELSKKGSLYLTRPTLYHYTRNRQEILDSAARYLAMLEKGHINIQVGESFALSDVAKAHDYLVQRNRIGSPVLIP